MSLCARPSISDFNQFIKTVLLESKLDLPNLLLCADINAKSPLWNSKTCDTRGKIMEDLLEREPLNIKNKSETKLQYIYLGRMGV